MNDKKAYTIVCIAPKNIQEQFDNLKSNIGLLKTETKDKEEHIILKNTTHFAIKRTFYLNEGFSEDQLLNKLEKLTFSPIEIECNKSGIFDKSKYGAIVFLAIEENKDLTNLHSKIKGLIDEYVVTNNPEHEGKNWDPHLTATYNTPQEKRVAVKEAVDNKLLPTNFLLDKIYLLKEYNWDRDEREIAKIFTASQGD